MRGLGSSVPQNVLERLALAKLADLKVPIRWGDPVSNVATDGTGVWVDFESGESIGAAYVIAADGARSVVRKSLGIAMDRLSGATPFIIVDVDNLPDGSTPNSYGYFHYECPQLGGQT